MQRLWRSTAYRIVPHDLLSLHFIAPRTISSAVELPTGSRILSHQSSIKKLLYRLDFRPVHQRHFLNEDSFFPDDPSCVKLIQDCKLAQLPRLAVCESWPQNGRVYSIGIVSTSKLCLLGVSIVARLGSFEEVGPFCFLGYKGLCVVGQRLAEAPCCSLTHATEALRHVLWMFQSLS